MQEDVLAVSRALFSAGNNIATKIAIMAIITSSSIKVKKYFFIIFLTFKFELNNFLENYHILWQYLGAMARASFFFSEKVISFNEISIPYPEFLAPDMDTGKLKMVHFAA